jgi:7-cyano-7-deazaguanine tRNA-ribosyltransferase
VDATAYDSVFFVKVPFGVYPEALNETYPIGQSEIIEVLECEARDATLENILDFIKGHPNTKFTFMYDDAWQCPIISEIGQLSLLKKL